MPDWAFYAAFLLAASFVMFNGFFMMIAPAKHRWFLAWITDAGLRSKPFCEQGRNGLEIERRFAGAGLTGIGIFLTWHAARNAIYGRVNLGQLPSVPTVANKSFPVAAGICLLIGGIFITFRPQTIVQWNKQHQPISTEVSDSTLVKWKNGARLLGVALMLGAVYTFWVTLK